MSYYFTVDREYTDFTMEFRKQLEASASKIYDMQALQSFQKKLPSDRSKLLITNLKSKAVDSKGYVLKLNSLTIELIELHTDYQQNIVYRYAEDAVFLQDKEMGHSFYRSFINRLRFILKDVRAERAGVYSSAVA